MSEVFFVSDGKLCSAVGGRVEPLASDTIESYRNTVRDINRRHEWKSTGSGAQFLGVAAAMQSERDIDTGVQAVAAVTPDKLIFAVRLEDSCGLYTKNPRNPDEPEGYIVRKADMRIYHIDYDPGEGQLVVSASEGALQKHLALCGEVRANFRFITEGDSVDLTPSFSLRDSKVIFFSSAGYYIDRSSKKHEIRYSNFSVSRFDLRSGDITEVASDEKYDYLLPRENHSGTLYCIRRPRMRQREQGPSPVDVLLMPVRLLRAIFGWLNFFTQRYTGDSLLGKNSGGGNPAKSQDKSDREYFIEGNLSNVEQTLKENSLKGEKYPGIAPRSWELVQLGAAGSVQVVKKGVLDYSFDGEYILCSNGKYLLRIAPDGGEEILCEAREARSPACRRTQEAGAL